MKKKFIVLITILGFLLSNAYSAEKEVPKAPKQQAITAKKIQPWIVAIVTILVATTGLIIVSRDKGKKSNCCNCKE